MHQLWCGHRVLKVMANSSRHYLWWQQFGVSRPQWLMEQQTWHMIQPIQEFPPQTQLILWDIPTSQLLQIQSNMHNQVRMKLCFLCVY